MAAPAGKRDAAGQEARQPRCIVWLAPHRSEPRALLHGLGRRGVEAVVAYDPPSVMRLLAAEATLAVIVAEPREQPRVDELCAAVRCYYPRTRLWRYEHEGDAGRPWLEAMSNGLVDGTASGGEGSRPASASATTHADGDRATNGAPADDATGAPPSVPPGAPRSGDASTAGRQPPPPLSSLTAEELEMLLGDSPGERGGRE